MTVANLIPFMAYPVLSVEKFWQYQMLQLGAVLTKDGVKVLGDRKDRCFCSNTKREELTSIELETSDIAPVAMLIPNYRFYEENQTMFVSLGGFTPARQTRPSEGTTHPPQPEPPTIDNASILVW